MKQISEETESETVDSLGFFEDISGDLEKIRWFFSTGSFYKLQKETIIPLVRKNIEIQGGYDDELEGHFSSVLVNIKQ
jgi:hypothetical protein